MIDRLWAGWRIPYVENDGSADEIPRDPSKSLFEGIEQSGLPDAQTYVLWRGERCFALLNAFPYTSGHLMVLPKRAVPELELLDADEHTELWAGVRSAVVALKAAYRPEGINVGINLGAAAGAGVPGHLHVHVLPRWMADTNFTTAIAEARVLPESLSSTWRKLTDAWPR
jgi:diadenosine tetraphosphate (Ap4A) HIT family hydrolase